MVKCYKRSVHEFSSSSCDHESTVDESIAELFSIVGIEQEHPLPLDKIIEKLGYSIRWFEPDESSKDVAGAVNHSTKVVHINNSDDMATKHNTLAHEIGHIMMHAPNIEASINPATYYTYEEKEAMSNCFALRLTMPSEEFREVYSNYGGEIEYIAKHFGVSLYLAKIRAVNLGYQ